LRTWFCSWTPNDRTKMPPDLFYGESCWTKLSFPHSESEFVWEVPLGHKISKIWICSFIYGPKLLNKNATKINLRWNLNKTSISPFWVGIYLVGTLNTQNFKILSTPLSFKYKTYEYRCKQICSMVKFVKTKLDNIVILPYFPYKSLGRS
jgi:hypothetical protein